MYSYIRDVITRVINGVNASIQTEIDDIALILQTTFRKKIFLYDSGLINNEGFVIFYSDFPKTYYKILIFFLWIESLRHIEKLLSVVHNSRCYLGKINTFNFLSFEL